MRLLAYLYSDPLLEPTPDPTLWGWECDRIYQDLASQTIYKPLDKIKKSGSGDIASGELIQCHNRPQLQQLLRDCQQERDRQMESAHYLLVRRLEELGDSVQEVSDRVAALEALGIRLILVEQTDPVDPGKSPLPTNLIPASAIPAADVRADMLRLIQEIQTQQRSRRIRQGHARNRVKAIPPPGKAPYGYRRGRNRYVVDRSTALVVKEFFEQFLLFGSLRGAVRHIAKKYGKRISPSTGQRWLTSPVYRGALEYKGGETIAETHEAILSSDEAAQVDRLLRRNRRLPSRSASAPRSLAGLVICQQCQSPMTVTRVVQSKVAQRNTTAVKEYLYLRPMHCPERSKCKAIAYDQILQTTIDRICEDLPRAVAGLALPDLDRVKQGISQAIAGKQQVISQLPELVNQGILDDASAQLRAYNLRTEIAELQNKLAQLPPVNLKAIAQTVSIPQFWLDLSESERRFYFREFLRQIELVRQESGWTIRLVFIF
ncbi:MAG: recombinase family protein [Synechococcales bacterium]|nr:recombinase family protein [Synechococcales bacterium]